MGESKRRKLIDPNYGKPKSTDIRGLIISSPSTVRGGSFTLRSSSLDSQELRSSLLYWDRLSWPTTNMMTTGWGPEASFLEAEGVMDRPRQVVSRIDDMGKLMSELPILTLQNYERDEPGIWSLGGGENSILVESGYANKGEGTLFHLYRAIPVPSPDTPLDDILKFRQDRRSELLAFRFHIEALSKEIEASSDVEEALNQRLNELDIACSNLARVCREWQFPVYLSDLKASFNFNIERATKTAVKVWTEAGKFHLDETSKILSAGAAAILSQLEIKSDIKLRTIKRDTSPFKYVYEVQKHLL